MLLITLKCNLCVLLNAVNCFRCIIIIIYNRKSASCTHVSALLHSLVSMSPELPSSVLVDGDSEQWNVPRVRKESNLQLSDAIFEKHDYQKPVKRKRRQIKDFDPRPEEYRGNAKQLLGKLLENVRGESLGVSLLFDEQCSQSSLLSSDTSVPSRSDIKGTVEAFKQSLQMSPAQLRHVEQSTREQQCSAEWFAVHRYRITASYNIAVEILHQTDWC